MESPYGFSSRVFCVFPLTLAVPWAVISTFLYSEGMAPVCELEKDEPISHRRCDSEMEHYKEGRVGSPGQELLDCKHQRRQATEVKTAVYYPS